jgi:osmoprotectant transport system permease protein
LIFQGLRSNFRPEVLTASVLCVVLALVADLVLLGFQRMATPWRRSVA